MPYAQKHYPFENAGRVRRRTSRRDFIAEGLDQTRGWFYTLLVLGTALFEQPPFKNVIVNGLILAEDGKKMSKRLKNYPPTRTSCIESYGADALRAYLIDSRLVRGEPLRFAERASRRSCARWCCRTGTRLVLHHLRRRSTTGRPDKWPAPRPQHLDRWILSRAAEPGRRRQPRDGGLPPLQRGAAAGRVHRRSDQLVHPR